MAITKAKKQDIYNKLITEGENQKAIIVFTTRDAKETVDAQINWELRSSARKNGVIIQVAKNTLINKAFPTIPEKLVGQSYIAFLEDTSQQSEVTVPKAVVSNISESFKSNFKIVGAIVNGEFYDNNKTIALSNVPSMEDSMSMLAGTLKSITAKIARTINEIPTSVVRGVKAAKTE